jgi:hypothetical protein
MGITDLHFESTTVDRYPLNDHAGLSLPTAELPMFAFPHQLSLLRSTLDEFPLPVFFTFVFTNVTNVDILSKCILTLNDSFCGNEFTK